MNIDKLKQIIEADSRNVRENSPITLETCIARHEAYFKNIDLKNKTILDIGSCFGFTGEYVLQNGAKHYTGLELQEFAVKKSKELLSKWNKKVSILHGDTRNIKDLLKSKKFDIVVAAGVIYTTVDIISLIKQICSLSKDAVIFDTLHPGVDHNKNNPIIFIHEKQQMNFTEDSKAFVGLGSRINPKGLQTLLNLNGFDFSDVIIPREIKEVQDAYNVLIKRNGPVTPMRFILQGKKKSINSNNYELADVVKNKQIENLVNFTPKLEKWEFDKDIANKFQLEAMNHIPDYQRVINLSIDICNKFINKDSKILEVGSALGHTIKCFNDFGFKNVIGVECSPSMIENSYKKEQIILSNTIPNDNFDAIVCNWTLHFIGKSREERLSFIKSMWDKLNTNGILIITDKTTQSNEVESSYYDFKLENGISEQEIEIKKQKLIGVLNTFPAGWYIKQFYDLGCIPEIINSRLGFTTFLCQKKM